MNTDNFTASTKTGNMYVETAKNIETRANTLIYKLHRPSPRGKNKKVIGQMMNKLGEE